MVLLKAIQNLYSEYSEAFTQSDIFSLYLSYGGSSSVESLPKPPAHDNSVGHDSDHTLRETVEAFETSHPNIMDGQVSPPPFRCSGYLTFKGPLQKNPILSIILNDSSDKKIHLLELRNL